MEFRDIVFEGMKSLRYNGYTMDVFICPESYASSLTPADSQVADHSSVGVVGAMVTPTCIVLANHDKLNAMVSA